MRGEGVDIVPWGQLGTEGKKNKDCRHTRFIDTYVKMQRDQLPHFSICFLLNRRQCGVFIQDSVFNISEQ